MFNELRREDLPPELVAALEAGLAEKFPGKQLVYVGDKTEALPPEIAAKMEEFKQQIVEDFVAGRCTDCKRVMPDWPGGEIPDDWDLPDGWAYFSDMVDGTPNAWQCPECDAKERQEDDDAQS